MSDSERQPNEEDRSPPAKQRGSRPNCGKCRNHGNLVLLRGHKRKCQYKNCVCDNCILGVRRREVMAQQTLLSKQRKIGDGNGTEIDSHVASLAEDNVDEHSAAAMKLMSEFNLGMNALPFVYAVLRIAGDVQAATEMVNKAQKEIEEQPSSETGSRSPPVTLPSHGSRYSADRDLTLAHVPQPATHSYRRSPSPDRVFGQFSQSSRLLPSEPPLGLNPYASGFQPWRREPDLHRFREDEPPLLPSLLRPGSYERVGFTSPRGENLSALDGHASRFKDDDAGSSFRRVSDEIDPLLTHRPRLLHHDKPSTAIYPTVRENPYLPPIYSPFPSGALSLVVDSPRRLKMPKLEHQPPGDNISDDYYSHNSPPLSNVRSSS